MTFVEQDNIGEGDNSFTELQEILFDGVEMRCMQS